MFTFEQQIAVLLEFPAMTDPVLITVPGNVLRYLDTHAERSFTPGGDVVYRQPADLHRLPALRARRPLEPAFAV